MYEKGELDVTFEEFSKSLYRFNERGVRDENAINFYGGKIGDDAWDVGRAKNERLRSRFNYHFEDDQDGAGSYGQSERIIRSYSIVEDDDPLKRCLGEQKLEARKSGIHC